MQQNSTFSSWGSRPFTECLVSMEPKAVVTEIELKKMTHLSEASRQKSGKLPSEEVVVSFVKAFGCRNIQKCLVRYYILYSVTLSSLYNLVYFPPAHLVFSKFQQCGHFGLPSPKDRQCLLLPNRERLPVWCRRHEWIITLRCKQ